MEEALLAILIFEEELKQIEEKESNSESIIYSFDYYEKKCNILYKINEAKDIIMSDLVKQILKLRKK
jgi:hypothetical protein